MEVTTGRELGKPAESSYDKRRGQETGQREDYLLKALRDFKSGARGGGGVAAMPTTLYDLQDSDLVALAHYLARAR